MAAACNHPDCGCDHYREELMGPAAPLMIVIRNEIACCRSCHHNVDIHIRRPADPPQRDFFPVFKPRAWEQGIDDRLHNHQAERVGVIGSSFPQVNEAVLFDEDFVTISVLSDRLQAMRVDLEQKHSHAALLHCRGLRKIANHQSQGVNCELCFDETVNGYSCESCTKAVCIKCFPMAFQDRVSENIADVSIEYMCPYCRMTFASFPQVSLLEDQVEEG